MLKSIGDPLPTVCPHCGHTFVFFDALAAPESVLENNACWGACDKCLSSTNIFINQQDLLIALNEGNATWTPLTTSGGSA